MSLSGILSAIGGVATAVGTIGSSTGWGVPLAAAGIGLSALGAVTAEDGKTVTQTTKTEDPTTPYRVKLPSGATITMYAHGKPGATTTTTKTSGGDDKTAQAIAAAAQTAGILAGKTSTTPTVETPTKLNYAVPMTGTNKLSAAPAGKLGQQTTKYGLLEDITSSNVYDDMLLKNY